MAKYVVTLLSRQIFTLVTLKITQKGKILKNSPNDKKQPKLITLNPIPKWDNCVVHRLPLNWETVRSIPTQQVVKASVRA